MKCKNCGTDLIQLPQKRKKEFCDSTCRSSYWQKEKRKEKNKSNKEEPKNNNSKEEEMPEGLNWKEKIEWYRNHKK